MEGRIIKGIAGFYYVHSPECGLVECHAKGIFRKECKKPLVGDYVDFVFTEQEKNRGSLTAIHDRDNVLLRPNVANVDQALVLFAAAEPAPNLNLLDRFLLMMEQNRVETLICFNKQDAASREQLGALGEIYKNSGYPVLFISAAEGVGTEEVRTRLRGRTTVLAGPSGVGKSTLCNLIFPEAEMEVGSISRKIGRGKHTTRHSELFYLAEGTYLVDTPSFTSLMLPDIKKEEISSLYREMRPFLDQCRYRGCAHISEPGCAVKEALAQGKIVPARYENYKLFYEEIRQKHR